MLLLWFWNLCYPLNDLFSPRPSWHTGQISQGWFTLKFKLMGKRLCSPNLMLCRNQIDRVAPYPAAQDWAQNLHLQTSMGWSRPIYKLELNKLLPDVTIDMASLHFCDEEWGGWLLYKEGSVEDMRLYGINFRIIDFNWSSSYSDSCLGCKPWVKFAHPRASDTGCSCLAT